MSVEFLSIDAPRTLVVLIPIFNEWELAGELLRRLDQVLSQAERSACVVFIDDGSHRSPEGLLPIGSMSAVEQVRVLQLARNVGHQRAIAIGLAWLAASQIQQTVVVMDGDGEDDPRDVPRLVAELESRADCQMVFAARTRRSENLSFQACYRTYQVVHRLLTGLPVKFGNFSAFTPRALRRLAVTGEIWNHYAAAAVHARIPLTSISTERAPRLGGRSSMNFVSLVVHGMSALSIFAPLIGVRVMVALAILGAAATGTWLLLGSGWSAVNPPNVSAALIGLGAVILFQQAALAFGLMLMLLASRTGTAFLPIRDYHYFVERVLRLHPSISGAHPQSEVAAIPPRGFEPLSAD